jgi:hypothetical protein
MVGTKSVMKAGVECTGINVVRKAHLFYPAQPLKVGMFYQVENYSVGNGYKPVDRVIEDLDFTHFGSTW